MSPMSTMSMARLKTKRKAWMSSRRATSTGVMMATMKMATIIAMSHCRRNLPFGLIVRRSIERMRLISRSIFAFRSVDGVFRPSTGDDLPTLELGDRLLRLGDVRRTAAAVQSAAIAAGEVPLRSTCCCCVGAGYFFPLPSPIGAAATGAK